MEISAEEQAGILADLAALNGTPTASGNNEDGEEETLTETNGETVETSEDSESDADTQADGADEPETDSPAEKKGKSGVPKLLSERNRARQEADYWKQRAKELEAEAGGYDDSNKEFVHATAKQIAAEMIADDRFYGNNPGAEEFKDKIQEYKEKHSLSTEDAYAFFMLKERPEDFAVNERKKSARKQSVPAVANPKLRVETNPKDMNTSDLEAELRKMVASGMELN